MFLPSPPKLSERWIGSTCCSESSLGVPWPGRLGDREHRAAAPVRHPLAGRPPTAGEGSGPLVLGRSASVLGTVVRRPGVREAGDGRPLAPCRLRPVAPGLEKGVVVRTINGAPPAGLPRPGMVGSAQVVFLDVLRRGKPVVPRYRAIGTASETGYGPRWSSRS